MAVVLIFSSGIILHIFIVTIFFLSMLADTYKLLINISETIHKKKIIVKKRVKIKVIFVFILSHLITIDSYLLWLLTRSQV